MAIPILVPGFTLIVSKVIPRESLGLEISYQMVISDIFNLLGASRIEVSRAAFMTIPKVDPKAKRPHGGSQGEVPSKNGKTLHTNVPMAIPMAPVQPLTHHLQIMSVEDSPDGEGSSEPDPPPTHVILSWRELLFHLPRALGPGQTGTLARRLIVWERPFFFLQIWRTGR